MSSTAEIGVVLARLVRIAVGIVVAIILLAVAFVVLGANPANTIVVHISDWASSLVGPFDDIFSLSSHKATVALDYGLAALVYAVVAEVIVRLLLTPADTAAGRSRARRGGRAASTEPPTAVR
jgi:hypothetical protein